MTFRTVHAKPVEADRVAVIYRSHLHDRTWVCDADEMREGDILAGPQGIVMDAAEVEAALASDRGDHLVWYRHSPDCWHLYDLDRSALSEDVLDLERT